MVGLGRRARRRPLFDGSAPANAARPIESPRLSRRGGRLTAQSLRASPCPLTALRRAHCDIVAPPGDEPIRIVWRRNAPGPGFDFGLRRRLRVARHAGRPVHLAVPRFPECRFAAMASLSAGFSILTVDVIPDLRSAAPDFPISRFRLAFRGATARRLVSSLPARRPPFR